MRSGIYYIENIQNKNKYYGKSVNLEKRKGEHFRTLRNNTHRNYHLQKSFNKYGESNFVFKILLYCESFELLRYEQFFVDIDNTAYNICKECSSSTVGITYTKEQKEKFSKINSGENNPMYGKKHSTETKRKMSEKARGEKNHNFGKPISEEHKRALSQSFSGENNPRAKLNWNDVHWIRKYRKEYTLKQLAEKFGICVTSINNIILDKSWKEGADHSHRTIGQNGDIE
jgi:group I intron endonuclease